VVVNETLRPSGGVAGKESRGPRRPGQGAGVTTGGLRCGGSGDPRGPAARRPPQPAHRDFSFQDLLSDAFRYIVELSSKAGVLLGSPVRALPHNQGSDTH